MSVGWSPSDMNAAVVFMMNQTWGGPGWCVGCRMMEDGKMSAVKRAVGADGSRVDAVKRAVGAE